MDKATVSALKMTREQPIRKIDITDGSDINKTTSITHVKNVVLTKKSLKKSKNITFKQNTCCSVCGWQSKSIDVKTSEIKARLHWKVCRN